MAATTPHPDPLPPPIESDEHNLYSAEGFDMSDAQMIGCIASLAALIFFAGLVVGALWL